MDSRNSIEMSGLADSVPPNENDPLLLTPTNTTDHAILTPATIVTDENQDQDNSQQSHNNKPCDGSDHPFCSRYANKKVLGQYIPEIDENHVRSKLRKTAASKRSKMLRNQFITATIIGLANIATLVCVWVYFPPDSRGIGTLRMGDCSEVTTIDSAIHMVLNVVSSLFLGASSYCMQILVAPSRREMDDAHSRGISLDIGVQSLRNLRWIKRNRIFQWGGIWLLSICLHLFWNSLTFTSTPVVSYASATVTSDFQAVGRDWASDPPRQISSGHDWSPVYDLYSQMANFTRLDKQECIDSYIDPLKTKKPVIVVASNVTTAQNDNSPVISGWVTGWDVWSRSPWWICQAYNLDFKLLCSREWAKTFVDDWTVLTYNYPGDDESNRPFWIKVDYCLVGLESDISRRCGLHYGTQIFIVVSVCTLLQCCFISVVWWSSRTKAGLGQGERTERTMVLMGDAIAEYLEHPGDLSESQAVRMHPQVWRPQNRLSWFKIVSPKIWGISLTLFALGIAAPMAILVDNVVYWKPRGLELSIPTIFNLGFGLNADFLGLGSETRNYSLVQCVFLANIVQLIISFIYLFYNNILTHQLLADQWVRFLRPDGKKSLRVSTPLGMQRSSYILSLPLTYSITLMIAMIILHWLVSQSLFVVQTIGFDTDGELLLPSRFNGSAVGYSILPIVLATICGGIMVIGLLVNSVVRSHQNVPQGFLTWGSSSAHIESLCQRPDEDFDAHLFPVSIGVVTSSLLGGPTGPPRLAFTTDIALRSPKDEEIYVLPARKEKPKLL